RGYAKADENALPCLMHADGDDAEDGRQIRRPWRAALARDRAETRHRLIEHEQFLRQAQDRAWRPPGPSGMSETPRRFAFVVSGGRCRRSTASSGPAAASRSAGTTATRAYRRCCACGSGRMPSPLLPVPGRSATGREKLSAVGSSASRSGASFEHVLELPREAL